MEKFRDRPRKKFRVSLIANIKCIDVFAQKKLHSSPLPLDSHPQVPETADEIFPEGQGEGRHWRNKIFSAFRSASVYCLVKVAEG